MTDLVLTDHARMRMQQRGLNVNDIEVIAKHGVFVEGGLMLTEKVARSATNLLRQEIAMIDRLKGKRVVCDGHTVVTAYHPGRRKARSLLRAMS